MQALACRLHQRQQAFHQEVMALAAFSRRFLGRIGKHIGGIDPVKAIRHQEMAAAILAFDAFQIGFGGFALRQGVKFASQSGKLARSSRQQRAHRHGDGAVPVVIENFGGIGNDPAETENIEIVEICPLGGIEIGIANIAPANDHGAAIGDPRLVVHAPVDASETQDEFQAAIEDVFPRSWD